MLETKELVKIYKPKKGVPVTAIDKVSLKFPDTGMVFLLGKSGSGKSTLLNLLGGLDSYNSGEIIIKGVSSKAFRQSHFDSYRNTYVGFIFQEYNILDEFTVGANIALAIELQNRKATDEEINKILEEVDLQGYGNRKPNELSGGQKQRVAIARALVKNPEIIMADEPSGALDSNTGKQIFETLKKLSKEKLVIIVSHDREFAEIYADRIIELADGKVISDVELGEVVQSENTGIEFEQSSVFVPCGYHLTEKDRQEINNYIDSLGSSLTISVKPKKQGKHFVNTDQSKITAHDGSKFKLIKSKLPLKNAFKIGANGLKYKKFRLVVTILLSCIAFGLFGLSDTFGAYNHIETCTNSLIDSDINYLSISKSKKTSNNYWKNWGYQYSNADLKEFKNETGTSVYGVYMPVDAELSFKENIDTSIELTKNFDIYVPQFSGYGTINKTIVKELGLNILAGELPNGNKNEVAISEYIFEVFKKAKYTDGSQLNVLGGKGNKKIYIDIKKYDDIIGKKVTINNVDYTVTAVIDTHLDIDRYLSLTEEKKEETNADTIIDYVLYSEFDYARNYSYASVLMVGDGHLDKLVSKRKPVYPLTDGYLEISNEKCYIDTSYLSKLSDAKDQKIIWVDGEKTELKENEIIVSLDMSSFYEIPDKYLLETGETDYKSYFKDIGEIGVFKTVGDEVVDTTCKIVGYIPADYENNTHLRATICDDKTVDSFTDGKDKVYDFAVGSLPKQKEELKNLVSYCYREDSDVRNQIQNPITFELDSVNEFLVEFSKIFLYIGLGFALFAAIMLSNFIAMSISYKKQEIGILRAIGSRSNDVFRIFFSESFIIAMINFLLSVIGVFVVTNIINSIVRNEVGILITVLSFSLRQVILLLAVSILVAFLASFFPVKKIASKKPIDAIRNR